MTVHYRSQSQQHFCLIQQSIVVDTTYIIKPTQFGTKTNPFVGRQIFFGYCAA